MRKLRYVYRKQRRNAELRGVDFQLTFEEWLKLWEDSGHLAERGPRKGQYCMARYGDKGSYKVGNVRICTVTENHLEKWSGVTQGERLRELNRERSRSLEFRDAQSSRMQGNSFAQGMQHSAEFRERQRLRMLGNTLTKGRKL